MELPTLSRQHALVLALVAVAALVFAGRYVDRSNAPRTEPVARPVAVTPPRRPPVLVHVVGAVRRPGLYRLREGSRIADAVEKAGGLTRRADAALVNLAAPVADGTQIVVPRRAPATAASAGTGAGPESGAPAPAGPVHLNSATVEQLDALPGIGPVTAQKIIDWRQQNGAFSSVDELDAIPGIGPKRLEQLRELVAP